MSLGLFGDYFKKEVIAPSLIAVLCSGYLGLSLSATACSISGPASVAHAASWSLGARDAVTVVDPFSQLKLNALCGFLELFRLGHMQPSQLYLWLSNLLPPYSQLLTTFCLPEVSASSYSPELFDSLAVAGWSLGLGVSALYTTSPVHSTRNKRSKLNTQTTGCAYTGASLTAGHSAQQKGPADCCLREIPVLFT